MKKLNSSKKASAAAAVSSRRPSRRSQYVFDTWDGKGKVDLSKTPQWWPSGIEDARELLGSLPGVKLTEIGRSGAGRPVMAAAWGPRQDLPNRTSFSLGAAIYGKSASSFYGEGERTRQSLVFLGNAHGLEYEGTVAALNVLNAVVTGKDLRGRAWPLLQRLGRKLRIVIIPHLNVDGRARYAWARHCIGLNHEDWRRHIHGDWKDGGKLDWPQNQAYMPLPLDKVGVLGAYFNDNGVNLYFDNGLGVEPQPETKALLSFLNEERPDCVILSHSDNGSLVYGPDPFLPDHYRQRQAQIGVLVGTRCKREGMKKSGFPQQLNPYCGQALGQPDVVYHTCGALPLLIEFPSGWNGVPGTFGEILDIGMYTLEEIMSFGVTYRFRPPDPWP